MSDFWDWAVRAYGGAGVAEACLSLQDDDGQNVPLLLWAVWMACEGREISDSLAAKAAGLARIWSSEAIEPLRNMRRRLKTALSRDDDGARFALREKIKAAELEAERALMSLLVALAEPVKFETNHDLNAKVKVNLRAAAAAWSENMPLPGLQRLREALSDGQFLRYNA